MAKIEHHVTTDLNEDRVVTPINPLFINETEVTFPSVRIEGGDVTTTVETETTFNRLHKVS